MPREVQITIDCADPAALAEHHNYASAVTDPSRTVPRLYFQRVAEPKQAKNRVHLDLRAAPGLEGKARMTALEWEAARLVTLGATRLARHEPALPLDGGHIVMAEPEGNEFCLDQVTGQGRTRTMTR